MSTDALNEHRARFGAPPNDPGERAEYWRARQDALPTNRVSDGLEPHEIEFYEWFTIDRGYRVELIPRDTVRFLPTNDFIWLDNGALVCEVKATSATYAAIKRRIHKAVVKSARRGVVKDNFIIDIRDQVLTGKVRRQLAGINARADDGPLIDRIWVWDRNGFAEIDLD
jgi:hypothetical protein